MLVLGCSGSGKSTLTKKICKKLDLPAIHLDMEFWNSGWVATPRDEWRIKVNEFIEKDKWVMDGTFSESFDLRFPAADMVVVISFSRITCIYRVIARIFKYRKTKQRPDMAEGCKERFNLEFFKYIWSFEKRVLPRVQQAIQEFNCEDKTVFLRNQKELEEFGKTF